MTLPLTRRRIILGALMIALTQSSAIANPIAGSPEVIELWPDGAPGAERVTVREEIIERPTDGGLRDRFVQHVTRPTMSIFRPRQSNGVAVLLIPGGSYVRVVIDKEGFETAEWLAERGFTAAVLRYRLPADGWAAGADAPVHDAARALALLRPGAKRVGVMGFSAGGHVTARLITGGGGTSSSQLDFAVLVYPVIAMTGPHVHHGSRQQLMAAGVAQEALPLYSPDTQVTSATPPTLLIHAADDNAVVPENSMLMYQALRRAGVRSELHVFDRGGHGFGLRGTGGKTAAVWPTLAANWALQAVAREAATE